MGIEELGLGLSTIGSLSIPPACTTSVNNISTRTGDDNIGSGDRDKRSRPFFVAERSGALEDDLKGDQRVIWNREYMTVLHECRSSIR